MSRILCSLFLISMVSTMSYADAGLEARFSGLRYLNSKKTHYLRTRAKVELAYKNPLLSEAAKVFAKTEFSGRFINQYNDSFHSARFPGEQIELKRDGGEMWKIQIPVLLHEFGSKKEIRGMEVELEVVLPTSKVVKIFCREKVESNFQFGFPSLFKIPSENDAAQNEEWQKLSIYCLDRPKS